MHFFIATLLIFSSMEVVSKPLMGFIDPFSLTFWRFTAGFIFFLLYPGFKIRIATIFNFKTKEWLSVFFLGILNIFLAMSLLQLSVKHCSSATSATIFSSNPIFVMIISSIMGYDKTSLKKAIGIIIGVSAIALIMYDKGFVFNMGVFLGLSAAVIFASYTVLSKKTVSKINPFAVNLSSFFFGCFASLIFILLTERELIPDISFFNTKRVIALFYLGFIVTGLGYVTFFETMKRFTAVSASLIFMLKPALSVIFAAFFLNELLSANFYTGLLILLIGTVFTFYDKLKELKKNNV